MDKIVLEAFIKNYLKEHLSIAVVNEDCCSICRDGSGYCEDYTKPLKLGIFLDGEKISETELYGC